MPQKGAIDARQPAGVGRKTGVLRGSAIRQATREEALGDGGIEALADEGIPEGPAQRLPPGEADGAGKGGKQRLPHQSGGLQGLDGGAVDRLGKISVRALLQPAPESGRGRFQQEICALRAGPEKLRECRQGPGRSLQDAGDPRAVFGRQASLQGTKVRRRKVPTPEKIPDAGLREGLQRALPRQRVLQKPSGLRRREIGRRPLEAACAPQERGPLRARGLQVGKAPEIQRGREGKIQEFLDFLGLGDGEHGEDHSAAGGVLVGVALGEEADEVEAVHAYPRQQGSGRPGFPHDGDPAESQRQGDRGAERIPGVLGRERREGDKALPGLAPLGDAALVRPQQSLAGLVRPHRAADLPQRHVVQGSARRVRAGVVDRPGEPPLRTDFPEAHGDRVARVDVALQPSERIALDLPRGGRRARELEVPLQGGFGHQVEGAQGNHGMFSFSKSHRKGLVTPLGLTW
jgi:hypothetical protein